MSLPSPEEDIAARRVIRSRATVALVVGPRVGVSRHFFPTHAQVYAGMSSTNGAVSRRGVSIEQAEALLRSLAGVAAARVTIGPQGKVLGVQIQRSDEISSHQLVRNVQSALLACFGLLIDSALIEFVSQIPPEPVGVSGPLEIVEPAATLPTQPAPLPEHRRVELVGRPIIERLRPNRIRCRVEIGFDSEVTVGQAEMLDGGDAVLRATARAVLDACRNADPEGAGSIELEEIRSVELAGRKYILAGVRAVEPRHVHYLAGAAVMDATAEEAAALATIQAVQQWTAARKPSARDIPQ